MDKFNKFHNKVNELPSQYADKLDLSDEMDKFQQQLNKHLQKFEMSGDVKALDNIFEEPTKRGRRKPGAKENKSNDSLKSIGSDTSHRQILKDVEKNVDEVVVKQEMMLPPTKLPKRGRKKNEVAEVTAEPLDKVRDSDVMIQMPAIDTIDLNDSGSSDERPLAAIKAGTKKRTKQSALPESTRTTRAARTKQKVKAEETKIQEDNTDTSVYEDAAEGENIPSMEKKSENPDTPAIEKVNKPLAAEKTSTPSTAEKIAAPLHSQTFIKAPPVLNETIVIQKGPALNETIILEKGSSNIDAHADNIANLDKLNLDDLMTDDESIEKKPIKKPALKHPKQIFSPYQVSPVKKRVEAFEKLANTPPMRVTRTKTKKLNDGEKEEEVTKKGAIPKTSVTSGAATPLLGCSNRFNLKSASTEKKPNRFFTDISSKTKSAYKASQDEYRRREKEKREKEAEALRKKEALMHAQIEEKRRKREEKEQKAKEHREALELAEKQKTIELQRQKEEKHKMLLLEKQEKLQKSKEEAEKRRLLTKQKREEKVHKLMEKSKPIYMTQKMPLLPTFDCYDSDDENASESKEPKPEWLSRDKMHECLKTRSFIQSGYINTFFSLKPHSPNLQEIFENIDPQKLVRKSSAVWSHQPRFTCMPKIREEHH